MTLSTFTQFDAIQDSLMQADTPQRDEIQVNFDSGRTVRGQNRK